MTNKIKLKRVHFIPKELETGILYYSEEFYVGAHLCPCGCGNKVITTIGPTDWKISEPNGKPTLYPSIGNWQSPCRSHYWIRNGVIVWAEKWTQKEIEEGRKETEKRHTSYYRKKKSIFLRIKEWFLSKE